MEAGAEVAVEEEELDEPDERQLPTQSRGERMTELRRLLGLLDARLGELEGERPLLHSLAAQSTAEAQNLTELAMMAQAAPSELLLVVEEEWKHHRSSASNAAASLKKAIKGGAAREQERRRWQGRRQ